MSTYTGGKKHTKKRSKARNGRKSKPRSRSRSRSRSKSRSRSPPGSRGILKDINKTFSPQGIGATTLGSLMSPQKKVHTLFDDYKPLKAMSSYVSDSPFSPSTYLGDLKKLHKGTNIPANPQIAHLMEKVNELVRTAERPKVTDNWTDMKEINPIIAKQFGGFGPFSSIDVLLEGNVQSPTLSADTKRQLKMDRLLNNKTLHGSLDDKNIQQVNNVLDNEFYVGRDTKYGMNPDKPYVAFTRHTS